MISPAIRENLIVTGNSPPREAEFQSSLVIAIGRGGPTAVTAPIQSRRRETATPRSRQ
jgi:hypothetical protein